MIKDILIYGDSNTWGFIPTLEPYSGCDETQPRYNKKDMWWYDLYLKYNCYINGNNGRTFGFDHLLYEDKNAIKTIDDDLKDIESVDLCIIMLGTNDLKNVYHPTNEKIVNNMDKIVNKIKDKFGCDFLIICPPHIISGTPITKLWYKDGEKLIDSLGLAYKEYAKEHGYKFISAVGCEIGVDGEHLTKNGHLELRRRVNEVL